MENTTLINITIIFAVSLPVLYLFLRLNLPSLLAFLCAGIALGPYGLGIIKSISEVNVLAEIGVVLLLFTIGIEFSLSNLQKIKRSVIIAGSVQMLSTIAIGFSISSAFGYSPKKALFFGFLVVMSSTAIVFKLLQERAELESPHGMNAAAILIFQDLMVVPLILIIPYLSDTSFVSNESILLVFVKAFIVTASIIAVARWVIPKVLYFAVKTRSRELFLLLIAVICLSTAWITHAIGLSPALGAFIAGLVISESEYSHEAIGNIMPFKDLFTGLFFVSVGMLTDLRALIEYPLCILFIIAGIIIVKSVLASIGVIILGYPIRTALLCGAYLAQIGEFSFLLAKIGYDRTIIGQQEYQLFILIVVIAMSLTPFIMAASPHVADAVQRIPFLKNRIDHQPIEEIPQLTHHLIIVGFGINGRNVAKAAKLAGIKYIIVEMNPTTVRKEKEAGENIFFGDASHEAVLAHAGIGQAKVLVVAIADHGATLRIAKLARRLNPNLYIIIRTRFLHDLPHLYSLGADEVIPEEYETSIEIFSRVLSKYLVPRQEIEKLIATIRAEGYQMFRSLSLTSDAKQAFVNIPHLEIARFSICERSPLAGKTLRDIALRTKYGITVVAIEREGTLIVNPSAHEMLRVGERVFIMGNRAQIESIYHLFEEGTLCEG
ncbi:MAG: cation:proton antiporter [Spirochaetes bacterium]|nr:cation:proton antiporter [Spirochaetota bacterium]